MSDTYKIFGGSPYVEGSGVVSNSLNYMSNGNNKDSKILVSGLTVAVMVFLVISTFSQKLIGWSRFLVTSLVGLLIAQELIDYSEFNHNDMYFYGAHVAWVGSVLLGWIYSKEA